MDAIQIYPTKKGLYEADLAKSGRGLGLITEWYYTLSPQMLIVTYSVADNGITVCSAAVTIVYTNYTIGGTA